MATRRCPLNNADGKTQCRNTIADLAKADCGSHTAATPAATFSAPHAGSPALQLVERTHAWAIAEEDRIEIPATPEGWQDATDDLVDTMEACVRDRDLTTLHTPAGTLRVSAEPNTGGAALFPHTVKVTGKLADGHGRPVTIEDGPGMAHVKDHRGKKDAHHKVAAKYQGIVRDAWGAEGPHAELRDLNRAEEACIRLTAGIGSESAAADAILRWVTADLRGDDRTIALEKIADGFTGTVQELRDAATGE